jgi:plastocyanin
MNRRRGKLFAPLAVLVLAAAVAVPAVAGAASAPDHKNIDIKGGASKKKNAFGIKDSMRFSPAKFSLASGGQVTINGMTSSKEGPHTFTLVKKSQLPKTKKQVENCSICNTDFKKHKVNEKTGKVGVPVLDTGAKGFDSPGDSIVIQPGKSTTQIRVTAKPGKTLYYLCIVHPWMQGKVTVK